MTSSSATLPTDKDHEISGVGFTFIDLFAGIGGMRLAFEAAGGRCVYTCEWDSYARKTYAANFDIEGHPFAEDIRSIADPADIPDHDVLVAGFPCQPFSIAGVSKKNALGRPHGFACETQGTLFFDVARIIEAKRPMAILLENVKNLLSHDGGRTFQVIRRTLEDELGYGFEPKVLDAKSFVPQHRERVFIVAVRDGIAFDWDTVRIPDPANRPVMRSILHFEDGQEPDVDNGRFICPDGSVNRKYVLSPKLWNYLRDYAAKHRAKGNGFGYGLVGPNDVSRTLSARYYKDGSEILVSRGPRRRPRRLTPRECARIMGFPNQYRIEVSDTRAYKQFGNSVVVPLVAEIALAMVPYVAADRVPGKALGARFPLLAAAGM
jgi:DNA (cytosine-5)-methyltransferase 1